MRKPADEILDWTVSEAPFTEEAEAPPKPIHTNWHWPRWATSRRVALTTGFSAAAVLVAVWAGAAWSEYQLKQEIQVLVQSEDSDPLIDFFDLPLPLLQTISASGTVENIIRVNPNLLRADVRRVFVDGLTQREMTFLQPQFYHRTQAGWERTTPPEDFWGAEVLERGPRLTFRYQQVDTEFVTALAPTLEKTLASACQIWECPPISFTVQWAKSEAKEQLFIASFDSFTSNMYGSRALSLSDSSLLIFAGADFVHMTIPSPHVAGLPSDTTSQKLYADTLSIMLLHQLALRLSANQDIAFDDRNPFRIALVARMAARLGLDTPRIPELLNPNPYPIDSVLWRDNYINADELRSALVITNRLLQTQPITAEAQLLKALAHADGVLSWMVDGLNLTTKEAIELSRAVNYQPWPIENLAANPGDVLLECADGIQVWRNNSSALEPLLTGYFPGSSIGAFSPDGQKLIARISGQLAVIDFSTGTLIWLPNGHSAFGYQWLDNTVLAYQLSGDAIGVRLYELYKGDVLAFDSDITSYIVSPNGQQAIIGRYQSNGQVLSLMPARGGEETPIGFGDSPAWSPKGEAIAFSYENGPELQIKIFILEQDEARTVLSSNSLDEAYSALAQANSNGWAFAQWAPTGEWLAFYFTAPNGNFAPRLWMGLVRRDGKEMRMIASGWVARFDLFFAFGSFSADGRYFAFGKPGEGLLIHDVEKGITRTISMPNLRGGLSWSPTGYDFLITTSVGIQRAHDARQTNPHIETISGPECTGAMWVPQPQP